LRGTRRFDRRSLGQGKRARRCMGREASGVGRGDGRPAGGSRYAATRATTPGAPGTRYVVLRDTSPLGARNRKPGGQASRTALRPHTRPAISSSGNVCLPANPRSFIGMRRDGLRAWDACLPPVGPLLRSAQVGSRGHDASQTPFPSH